MSAVFVSCWTFGYECRHMTAKAFCVVFLKFIYSVLDLPFWSVLRHRTAALPSTYQFCWTREVRVRTMFPSFAAGAMADICRIVLNMIWDFTRTKDDKGLLPWSRWPITASVFFVWSCVMHGCKPCRAVYLRLGCVQEQRTAINLLSLQLT